MKTTKLNNSFIVLFLSLVLFFQSFLNNNIVVNKNRFEICTLHHVKFVTNWTFETEEFNCCSDFLSDFTFINSVAHYYSIIFTKKNIVFSQNKIFIKNLFGIYSRAPPFVV